LFKSNLVTAPAREAYTQNLRLIPAPNTIPRQLEINRPAPMGGTQFTAPPAPDGTLQPRAYGVNSFIATLTQEDLRQS